MMRKRYVFTETGEKRPPELGEYALSDDGQIYCAGKKSIRRHLIASSPQHKILSVKVEDVPPQEGKVAPVDTKTTRGFRGCYDYLNASSFTERLYLACRELVNDWPKWKNECYLGNLKAALDDVLRFHKNPPQPAPLKPCPFCREEPHVRNSWNVEEQRPDEVVWCRCCGIQLNRAAWNRRAS